MKMLFFCGMDIKKYITKSLFEKIVRSRKAEPSGDLLSPSDPNYLGDGDYFTHTQDYAAEWASLMTTKVMHESSNLAVVRVFVNSIKDPSGPLAVCVRLQRDASNWKIYQVDLFKDTNLPDCKGK